jgi:hypothetical protein
LVGGHVCFWCIMVLVQICFRVRAGPSGGCIRRAGHACLGRLSRSRAASGTIKSFGSVAQRRIGTIRGTRSSHPLAKTLFKEDVSQKGTLKPKPSLPAAHAARDRADRRCWRRGGRRIEWDTKKPLTGRAKYVMRPGQGQLSQAWEETKPERITQQYSGQILAAGATWGANVCGRVPISARIA